MLHYRRHARPAPTHTIYSPMLILQQHIETSEGNSQRINHVFQYWEHGSNKTISSFDIVPPRWRASIRRRRCYTPQFSNRTVENECVKRDIAYTYIYIYKACFRSRINIKFQWEKSFPAIFNRESLNLYFIFYFWRAWFLYTFVYLHSITFQWKHCADSIVPVQHTHTITRTELILAKGY
jgi:hypothetical protein